MSEREATEEEKRLVLNDVARIGHVAKLQKDLYTRIHELEQRVKVLEDA